MRRDALRIAQELGITIEPDREFEAWRDDCLAHDRRYVDWAGAWRNRIRNAAKFAPSNGNGARASSPAPQRESRHPSIQEVQRQREAEKAVPMPPEERETLYRGLEERQARGEKLPSMALQLLADRRAANE
jgi:hypothetical protein